MEEVAAEVVEMEAMEEVAVTVETVETVEAEVEVATVEPTGMYRRCSPMMPIPGTYLKTQDRISTSALPWLRGVPTAIT